MKNTELRQSARIANSSAETIDTNQTEITDETKSASEIDKSLPDIIPPRWITRSSINLESKSVTRNGNEISPSTDQSTVINVSRRSTHSCTSKPPINSATMKYQPDHPSPSAVVRKISGIVTRSHMKEENVDRKEPNKVEKATDLDNKTTCRITRSQNVVSTGDEPARMRTRSQSSDKSEMSSKSMKTADSTHDEIMDVTVSVLSLNIDANHKNMFSPLGKKDDDITYGDFTPTISQRKRRGSKADTTDDVSKNKREKKKSTEVNKNQNDPGDDTNRKKVDAVEPVNSDNRARGYTSENSSTMPTPTPKRMRTRSAKSTNGQESRSTSSQKTPVTHKNRKGNEDDDDFF